MDMEMDTSPDRTLHLPPETVRIKRKRGQDPLQALLVDESHGGLKKKSKPNNYVFRLAGTFDQEPDALNDNTLIHDENNNERQIFRLPKKKKNEQIPHEDPQVSKSLTDMVQNYLDLERPLEKAPSSPPKSTTNTNKTIVDDEHNDAEIEDYVYDIYYREKYNNDDLGESSKIGLIFFDSDEEGLVGVADSDDEQDTGDEDSNAEDFYKNDYPDEPSSDEGNNWSDEEDGELIVGGQGEDGFRHAEIDFNGYDQFDDDEDDFNDDTFENWSEDEDYEQYRERIWGKLERAIEEEASKEDEED